MSVDHCLTGYVLILIFKIRSVICKKKIENEKIYEFSKLFNFSAAILYMSIIAAHKNDLFYKSFEIYIRLQLIINLGINIIYWVYKKHN